MKPLFVVFCFCLFPGLLPAQMIARLQKGLVIRESVIIEQKTYAISADTGFAEPLIVIEGSDLTVDFNDAILKGTHDATMPDEFTGLAILIRKGSSHITLKNATIHGYKIALVAEGVSNLTIENCDFSYNYRQHLYSNLDREDISDWMSYHHNEQDEWMRYGAGIYLKECNNAVIKRNTVTNGQCGLLLVRCNYAEVAGNNFSFNSGIGIGLYRSSNNRIFNNRLDFNVRGFHFGKYHRGQDSAGILVFEQCNNNLIAYNSVTHSGDGFFLWAGQYTMDTGEGGCNDNLLYGNDFSWAPTNGVELTFSRNIVSNNIIKGCDHGIWGGYSFSTEISSNHFADNRIAIAIEHGQHNGIRDNHFSGDKTGIKLWSRASQPAGWGYAEKRDTRSVGFNISGNEFIGLPTVFDIMGTDSILLAGNKKINCNEINKFGERTFHIDSGKERNALPVVAVLNYAAIDSLGINAIPATLFPRGREQMRITKWGPYNFEYPVLWLKNIDSSGLYHFEVLGKPGSWKVISSNGFKVHSKGTTSFPSTLLAKADKAVQNRSIQLAYTGEAFTSMFGSKHTAGKPYKFGYKEFDAQAKWKINFYKWDSTINPLDHYEAFSNSLQNSFFSTTAEKVDYTWWGSIGKNLPADSFATVATTTVNLPEANYEIGLTADDLVKLFMDGKPLIDAWDPHFVNDDGNTHHTKLLRLSGKHVFKIVHAEIGGLATLMFYIQPVD